jgi:hypothetical protein
MTTGQKILISTLFLLTTLCSSVLNDQASASAKSERGVQSAITIEAPPRVVFEAIQHSRILEPMRRKLVSHHEGVAIIDEHFEDLPVIGSASCTYKEVEVPYSRIDFTLVDSAKLKTFEGSWVLTPVREGECTEVRLRTFSEPKIWLPFAKEASGPSILKDIRRRLTTLKAAVETADHCAISTHSNMLPASNLSKNTPVENRQAE